MSCRADRLAHSDGRRSAPLTRWSDDAVTTLGTPGPSTAADRVQPARVAGLVGRRRLRRGRAAGQPVRSHGGLRLRRVAGAGTADPGHRPSAGNHGCSSVAGRSPRVLVRRPCRRRSRSLDARAPSTAPRRRRRLCRPPRCSRTSTRRTPAASRRCPTVASSSGGCMDAALADGIGFELAVAERGRWRATSCSAVRIPRSSPTSVTTPGARFWPWHLTATRCA